MILEAIVFDFDGVIADTEPLHLRAYQSVLQNDGIELSKEEYDQQYLGYDDVGLFRALAESRGLPARASTIDHWIASKSDIVEHLLSSDSVLFPGAVDCITMCASRVPLAIASGALAPEIELVLEQSGLRDCFQAIASASDRVPGKPAPDLYLLAMKKLRAARSAATLSCIAVEDSHWGIDAARAAGLRCVAVTHTYPRAELHAADFVVDYLSDITIALLQRVLSDNNGAV